MTEETPIYEKDSIKITNLRAVFGEKTYSVSNITSVEAATVAPKTGFAFIVGILGIFMTLCGITDVKQFGSILFFGVLALVLFFFMHRSAKTSWAVSLTTAAGEVKAYTSDDQDTIKQIVEALNNAIVRKG